MAIIAFFLPVLAARRSKRACPVRVVFDRNPGHFDEYRPQIPAALLGNATSPIGLSRGRDTAAQSAVAGQLFGGRKAGNLANGGQRGQSGHQANTGQLEQQGHGLGPRIVGRQVGQFLLDLLDERSQALQQGQILSYLQVLQGGQRQTSPPHALLGGKRITRWWRQIVPM